ncbi:PepSY-like domain-containing protein [Nafulsella turpanensis]|uniref:PepSY-like domain-containing protein n=1 Tax=Nafulsella turpanensis TaxID=1265690 RepID=UPI0004778E65|nr:PepSY-like domain-containing protein [Nafulsella turpanensis]
MRRILLSISFLFLFTGFLMAQQGGEGTPPLKVKAIFTAKYPDYAEQAKWERTANGYIATFQQNGQEVRTEFNENGEWISSRTAVRQEEWPEPARKYITDTFKDYEYVEGYRLDNQKGSRYELDIRSNNQLFELQFDRQGGLVDDGRS